MTHDTEQNENIAQTVARLVESREAVQIAINTDTEHPDVIAMPAHWSVRDLEQYFPSPRRMKADRQMVTVDGFAAYVTAHALEAQTAVYVDHKQALAVIDDANTKTKAPAWGDHKAALALARTPEWGEWSGQSGQFLAQRTFINWIQDRAGEIAAPPLGDLVQELRDITANSTGTRRDRAEHLSSSKTSSAATAVANNLPEYLDLHVPILKCEPMESTTVQARLQVKLAEDGVQFSVTLVNEQAILDRRIREFVTRLNAKIGTTVPVYF